LLESADALANDGLDRSRRLGRAGEVAELDGKHEQPD
jgi:hypothetical protein